MFSLTPVQLVRRKQLWGQSDWATCSEQVLLPSDVTSSLDTSPMEPPCDYVFLLPTSMVLNAAASAACNGPPQRALDILQLTPADFINKDKDDILIRLQAMSALIEVVNDSDDTVMLGLKWKLPKLPITPCYFSPNWL